MSADSFDICEKIIRLYKKKNVEGPVNRGLPLSNTDNSLSGEPVVPNGIRGHSKTLQ